MKGYKEEICLFTWTPMLSDLVLEGGGAPVLGWITLSDIYVKQAGALPWSPELGRDKLFEIEYFIRFSRILHHNVHFGHTRELSQLANIILDILSQLQTLYKEHSVK